MRKDDKINLLLDYCRRHPTGFEMLLKNVLKEYASRVKSSNTSNFHSEQLDPLIDALSAYITSSAPIPPVATDSQLNASPPKSSIIRPMLIGALSGIGVLLVVLLIAILAFFSFSGLGGEGPFPHSAGTPLPKYLPVIVDSNMKQIREIARWDRERVREIAHSPNGKLLAVNMPIGIYLYDTQTLQEVRFLDSQESISSMAFSPDETLLAVDGPENNVQLCQVSDGQCFSTFKGHTSHINSVSFRPDGEILLASGSHDKTVRLWSVSDKKLFSILEGHTETVTSVSFSPDGDLLASGSDDKTVLLWRVSDGELLNTLKGHTHFVNDVSFSPDGEVLASGSCSKGDRFYDCMAGEIRLWRVSDGQPLNALQGHTDSVTSVSFSPSGQLLASGSYDNTVRLWHVSDGKLLKTLEGHTIGVSSVSFSPDGRWVASSSWNDGTIRLWGVVP